MDAACSGDKPKAQHTVGAGECLLRGRHTVPTRHTAGPCKCQTQRGADEGLARHGHARVPHCQARAGCWRKTAKPTQFTGVTQLVLGIG